MYNMIATIAANAVVYTISPFAGTLMSFFVLGNKVM